MEQIGIPFVFMRGGSSRGPYFKRGDLPEDLDRLSEVLIAAIGSGHALNIDGIGGGNAVTTKVAMLSPSGDSAADIDYFFAQVSVEDRLVDYKPTCGNILAGVGAAALEMNLMEAQDGITDIRIRAVNTGARILARVETPNAVPRYDGAMVIDGVPGSAAPVELNFMEVAGSSTGKLLPTGNLRDEFDGITTTCMDVAMPMVIAMASDFGLSGDETREELDANKDFFERMEAVRLKAGEAMGLGDCTKSVTPKFGLFAPAPNGEAGHIAARYFMPWNTHPTMAVTGSQCLASCALMAGTIAEGMMAVPNEKPARITLHHPLGVMEVLVDYTLEGGKFVLHSAGLIRTARKLAEGKVFVPSAVWD